MTKLNYLKLKAFLNIYLDYKNPEKTSPKFFSYSVYGLIKTIFEYYNYALASFDLYTKELKGYAKNDFNNNHKVNLMTTTAFGIYTNGNVCLQIAKKLNEYIRDFSKNEDINKRLKMITKNEDIKEWSKSFRKKRNLIVVHPAHNKNPIGNCNCFPDKCARITGWGTGGFSFDIYSMLTGETHSEYEIVPYDEIKQLSDYLEALASVYYDFFIKK